MGMRRDETRRRVNARPPEATETDGSDEGSRTQSRYVVQAYKTADVKTT